MDQAQALDAFAALSQETRLEMVRTLVRAGTQGLPAGAVAEGVGVSSSSASFHLAHLERAGLVQANLSALVGFLMRDCCQGHPEVCAPAVDALSASSCCVAPKELGHG
ncbi:MAG: helix-turn-helix transcriptional regulator [Rhizobiales bacterium]|nr:helix-turn-helix transcriptional regulator [Hyphomicrobiales bacterium]